MPKHRHARHARTCAILFAAGLAQPVGDTLLCLKRYVKSVRENDGVLASKKPRRRLSFSSSSLSPFVLVSHKNISQDQNTRALILPSDMMRGLEETARFTLTLDRRWRCLDVEDCTVLVRTRLSARPAIKISLRRTKRAGRRNSSANSYPWSRCSVSATIPLLRTKREGTARPTH